MIKNTDWPYNFTRRLFRYRDDSVQKNDGLVDRVEEVLDAIDYPMGKAVVHLYYRDGLSFPKVAAVLHLSGHKKAEEVMRYTYNTIERHDQFIGVIRGDFDSIDEYIETRYPDKRKVPLNMIHAIEPKLYNYLMKHLRDYRRIQNPTVGDLIIIIRKDYLQGVQGIGPFNEKKIIAAVKGLGFTDEELAPYST